MSIPTTKDRVPSHTAEPVNQKIEHATEDRVRHVMSHGSVEQRLKALDAEWDIERAIEANASVLAFIGIALAFFVHPYWLALPGLVTAFLFQHAVQGWCPPVPILRRLGFRTVYEIEQERHALKALRGDYALVVDASDKAAAALKAAQA